MKTRRALIMLLLLIGPVTLPLGLRGAETPASQMAPAPREMFDKGMASVEQKEWLLAADSFEKAWKINTQSKAEPEIVFNWALAESKMPGRELRAIACFNLYLSIVAKDAANVEAVRKEKTALEVRNEARLRKLIAEAKKFAGQLQGDDEFRRRVSAGGYDLNKSIASLRRVAYARVARAQARAGDFTGAMQTAQLVRIPPGTSLATEAILVAQGDYHGADEQLTKEISELQAEAEKSKQLGRDMTAMNLRDLLRNSNFNKASITDPAATLQALADKKRPEDLFYGYMQVIDDMIFVLRKTDGRGPFVSD